jgi:hypothetical protein
MTSHALDQELVEDMDLSYKLWNANLMVWEDCMTVDQSVLAEDEVRPLAGLRSCSAAALTL